MNTLKLRIPSKNITYRKNKKMASILDGFNFDDIEDILTENPYFRGYLQGYLAEFRLKDAIKNLPGVTSVTKIPDFENRKGDLEVIYKDTPITIECKSIESNSVKEDPLHNSWVGTVCIKNSGRREILHNDEPLMTTSLVKGAFDLLAVSCYAVNEQWNFLFMENRYLPESPDYPGLISTKIQINPQTTSCLIVDPLDALERVWLQKTTQSC